jgi:hypothetical protein
MLPNGRDLTKGRLGFVVNSNGTRGYSIDLEAKVFDELCQSKSATINVNDVKVTLNAGDLLKLGDVVASQTVR